MLTIAIPVGPNKVYKEYLQECLDSLKDQTVPPDEVLLIDDMAALHEWELDYGELPVKIHKNPWLCGCAHSFNFGVALAENELVIMLGSDDKLFPWAVEDAIKSYRDNKEPRGYYYFDVMYSDTGETQSVACNCAMVTKTLWKHCGGFPIQTSVGANDYIFLGMIMAEEGEAGNIIRIESESPPYWYRRHKESVTSKGNMWPCIEHVKGCLTGNWKHPEWGRYD